MPNPLFAEDMIGLVWMQSKRPSINTGSAH
jgi:hypothetical protein